jgi:hypothetical protein
VEYCDFSQLSFKNDPRLRKLVTHHVGPIYCGDASNRFLALGNDRSKENPAFGNLYASDDLGKTWKWLEPELLNKKCAGYGGIVSNDKLVVIADKLGSNASVIDSPVPGARDAHSDFFYNWTRRRHLQLFLACSNGVRRIAPTSNNLPRANGEVVGAVLAMQAHRGRPSSHQKTVGPSDLQWITVDHE